MPATLATVDKILKEVYEGKIQNQLTEEAVGYKRIERTSRGVEQTVGGKYVTFPLRVRRNHGIGYRQEGETLQQAGQQGYAAIRIGLKYGYGRVELTGQTMELADKNYQAFASVLDQEMTGIKNDILRDTNRIFYGDGVGTLATATTVAGPSTTVTVKAAKYLEPGMQIDQFAAGATAASVAKAANFQVVSVDYDANTFVASTPITTAVGDILVRTGNVAREPNGLAGIVTGTGVLHNLDAAVEPTWKAVVDANGGVNRALSEGMLIKNTDKIRSNGGKTTVMLASLGVRRAYFNLLSQQRRYPSTTSFAGGVTGLAFNNGREIPFVEDTDAPDNTIYGLEEDSLKIYRSSPWEWMQRDGSIWKWIQGKDAYEAVMNQYWEIGVNKRNANFVIKDITEG